MSCNCLSGDPRLCTKARGEDGLCECRCHYVPDMECNFREAGGYCKLKTNAIDNECDGYDKCILMAILRSK